MQLEIYEVFAKVAGAATKAEKIEILKKNDGLGIRDVLRGAFDDTIIWELPKGCPKLTMTLSTEGLAPTTLRRMTKDFGYFVKGGIGGNLQTAKKERMWLAILDGIHPKDAEVLTAMKDKKFAGRYKGLTAALVREVWPKLLAPEVVKKAAEAEPSA